MIFDRLESLGLIQIIWEYRVKRRGTEEFVEHYSGEGLWGALFQKDQAYHGTDLMCDIEDKTRYLTIDTWDKIESYTQFKKQFAKEYEALDRKCEEITDSERCVGVFELVE